MIFQGRCHRWTKWKALWNIRQHQDRDLHRINKNKTN